MSTQNPWYEDIQAVQRELRTLREKVELLEYRLRKTGQRAYVLPVLLEPDETGGFVVTSPILPGLVKSVKSWKATISRRNA